MVLGYAFLLTVLISSTTCHVVGTLDDNVCSYTTRRSFHNIDDPFLDENDYQNRATAYRCCDGWTRPDGNREGNAPCYVPICTKACGSQEICYRPNHCACFGLEGCPSIVVNNANGKKSKVETAAEVDRFTFEDDDDTQEKEQTSNNNENKRQNEFNSDEAEQLNMEWIEKSEGKRSKRSTTATCPVALPQYASSNCSSQRKVELATNRFIYTMRDTPNFNDPNRNKDILLTPLWNVTPQVSFGVAFSDSFEGPWLNSYLVMTATNAYLGKTWASLANNSIREFTQISDWRELFFFYYSYLVNKGSTPSNYSDLAIDKWQDDRVFAEQQLAGINPFNLKRLIARPCPPRWTLVGETCYKIFTGYRYSSIKDAKDICKCNSAQLAVLSSPKQAINVNQKFRSASKADDDDDDDISTVYVDGTDGVWADGRRVRGAINRPKKYRRCLSARFTHSGLVYAYTYCITVRKIGVLCQKSANIHGVKISTLRPNLNLSFKWKQAIESKLKSTSSTYSNKFIDAVEDGRVYVAEYPELKGLRTNPDAAEVPNDGRTMLPLASPIAIFVSNPDVNNGEFLPVAIQTNSTPSSPVYTPKDGDNWIIAKLLVQSATFTTAEILEHLLHAHLVNDPICLSYKRHLPLKHPLGQLLLQHCLGTLTTSKVAEISLLPVGGRVDQLFTIGVRGEHDILNNGFNAYSFKKINDPNYRMKKAGLSDKKALPFHPYRDDSFEINKIIGEFARDYVNMYYKSDAAVIKDNEVQLWANEIAYGATGTSESGKGKIRDFPKSFTTKAQLIDTLHKFIWSSSCHHASVNFPVIEYGAFLPNMPGKLYTVENITGFHPVLFPTREQTMSHVDVGFNLGTLHYDVLFDYEAKLADPKAIALVKKYKARMEAMQTKLVARNNANLAKGHLSYRYLHPANIPNSITT